VISMTRETRVPVQRAAESSAARSTASHAQDRGIKSERLADL